jgi:ABC-type multidrug transport system ATPase subunit
MAMCGEGVWCPESAIEPIPCDGFSVCSENSTFQINFVVPVISAIITLMMFLISWIITSDQKTAELRAREEPETNQATSFVTPVEVEEGGISISFENVFLTTSVGSTVLLDDVSGKIDHGSIYAIMGPTGCGKSSLINILRNGCFNDTVSGKIEMFNSNTGRVLNSAEVLKCTGFVPQEDILDRSLTIRELLTMHAMLRSGDTYEEAHGKAVKAMSDLHIRNIADTIIGGSETTPANISGGQLKRVNIACELVSIGRPAVLFLDEPTAGLDANIAKELVVLLKALSSSGVLVVLSVQQPRPEIFNMFSRVMLMINGGRVAYEGVPDGAVPYLASVGFKLSGNISDADFCIDVLNCIIKPAVEDAHHIDLGEKWRARSISKPPVALVHLDMGPDEVELGGVATSVSVVKKGSTGVKEKVIPEVLLLDHSNATVTSMTEHWGGFNANKVAKQLVLSVKRQFLTSLRNRVNLCVCMALQVLGAIVLSVAFSPLIQDGGYLGTYQMPASKLLMPYIPSSVLSKTRNNSDIGFKQMMFFLPAILGAMTALCAVPLFSGRIAVMKRESQTGVSPVASGLGYMVFDLLIVVWMSINYCAAWQLFGHAGHYYHWFLVIIFTSFAASGIGYITGVSVSPMSANTVAVVSSIIFAVFSGVEPTLRQVNKLSIVSLPWYLSYATWTAEGTYYTWTQYLSSAGIDNDERVELGADHYGYEVSSLSRAIGCLIGLGVGFRILALIILYIKCS